MNNDGLLTYMNKSRHLIFLAMLYIVILILSAVFFYRYIDFDHIALPGGMFVYPILYVITDIVTELYGYSTARLFIWYGIFCNFIFGIIAFFLTYTPTISGTEFAHDYNAIFREILRLDAGNFVGQLLGSFINIYMISKWKILVKGRFFFVRSVTSNLFGEFVMLTVTGTIVLAGRLPMHEIFALLAADYVIRILFCFIFSTPAAFFVSYIKNKEKIDVYDLSTKFNPFRLSITNGIY